MNTRRLVAWGNGEPPKVNCVPIPKKHQPKDAAGYDWCVEMRFVTIDDERLNLCAGYYFRRGEGAI